MSATESCERTATRDDGTVSSLTYNDCMDKHNSDYKKDNADKTRDEERKGTIPNVELTEEENVVYEMTGDNAYRVQDIAQAVTDDLDEPNNITDDDIKKVLADGQLPNGEALTPELTRALKYMLADFHDMTDESDWNIFDQGDLSAQEITDWAKDEHGTTLEMAQAKKEQQRAHDEQKEERKREDGDESDEHSSSESKNEKDESKKDKGSLQDVLEDPNAKPEDKLKAVKELSEQGVNEVDLIDNGKHVHCVIRVEPVSSGSNQNYVHLFAVDDRGKEQIVLRAIEEDGKYSSETGNGFVGTKWSQRDSNIA